MTPNNSQLLELPSIFKSLLKKMSQEWKQQLSGNITITQFRMLFILDTEGPQKAMDMAEALAVTSGAVTGISDKLVERGLVERSRSEDDRRVVYLGITQQGRQLLGTLLEHQKEMLGAFFGRLPEEDVQHLKRIFTYLLNQFDQKERG